MTEYLKIRRGSDEFDEAIKGFVMAERINDIVAKPSSKRYRGYLERVQEEFAGEPHVEIQDQYRDQAKELLPRAIDAYETRHGVELETDRVYFYEDKNFALACAPDAVESDLVGFTVHVRQVQTGDDPEATYRKAVEEGVTPAMERVAQASMLVSGIPHWIHMDYYQNEQTRTRKLHEHLVDYDKRKAAELERAMIFFLAKTRFAREVA